MLHHRSDTALVTDAFRGRWMNRFAVPRCRTCGQPPRDRARRTGNGCIVPRL